MCNSRCAIVRTTTFKISLTAQTPSGVSANSTLILVSLLVSYTLIVSYLLGKVLPQKRAPATLWIAAHTATPMVRYLLGITEEERQQRRDEILGTTPADLRTFGDALEAVKGGSVVVVTSPETAAKV